MSDNPPQEPPAPEEFSAIPGAYIKTMYEGHNIPRKIVATPDRLVLIGREPDSTLDTDWSQTSLSFSDNQDGMADAVLATPTQTFHFRANPLDVLILSDIQLISQGAESTGDYARWLANPNDLHHLKAPKSASSRTDTAIGCSTLIGLAVLLYFLLTSCMGGSGGLNLPGQSCHDRVSTEYVKGELTDTGYINQLNSQCSENN